MSADDRRRYLGLMTGTSIDGIDAVLVEVRTQTKPGIRLVHKRSTTLPDALRECLHRLAVSRLVSLDEVLRADVELGGALAGAALTLIAEAGLATAAIRAIGSHGQTVRHQPLGPYASSLQIGDPNVIAEQTGIAVVADLRRRDMAAGGQGAPLLPALHHALLSSASLTRVVVNLGGIANITVLPAGASAPSLGFDTGPANTLLDGWAQRHLGAMMDKGGAWGRAGTTDADLLGSLLREPYLSAPPPKSTGRELFNLAWLDARLTELDRVVPPVDVQHTLVHYTATTVAQAIKRHAGVPDEVIVTGGGAHNAHLMGALAAALDCRTELQPVSRHGVDGDALEAMAFAWFAHCRLEGLAVAPPSLTGARHPVVLGGLYPGRPPQGVG